MWFGPILCLIEKSAFQESFSRGKPPSLDKNIFLVENPASVRIACENPGFAWILI